MAPNNRLKAPRTFVRGGLDELNQGAWEALRIEKSWLVSIRDSFFKPLLSDHFFLSVKSCKSCPKFLSFGSVANYS
jgi:hypothetical protein